MNKLIIWAKNHQSESLFLIVILVVAAFLRLYHIDQYLTFLGDEGRDARVVRRLIVDLDPVFIGPMTSVTTEAGHMYLGPLYYYLMAPAMIVSGLSPVGPAVMIALFSLATIILIWWLGRTWFHPLAGLTAAALYAISPTVIIYSRSSWNPNIMPFFALLTIWATHQIYQYYSLKAKSQQPTALLWFLLLGISLAFVIQSHYLGLLLIPTIAVFWLAALLKIRLTSKRNHNVTTLRQFIKHSAFSLLIFLFLMSPLVLFDLRHDWLNLKAITAFFTHRQTTVNLKFYRGFAKLYPILEQIYSTLVATHNTLITKIILTLTGLTLVTNLIHKNLKSLILNSQQIQKSQLRKVETSPKGPLWRKRRNLSLLLLLTWLLFGLLGLSLYKQHIYDHYFGFLFPAPFLLTGWVIWQITRSATSRLPANGQVSQLLIAGLLISPLIYLNLQSSPLKSQPPQTLQHTQEIDRTILQASQGQPFNLALIAKNNYDEGYRYFFELWHAPLVEIDPQNAPQTITNQLFVICENRPPYEGRDMDCNPISHPKAEIALFGWAKIDQQWTFPWGFQLYRLVHY